MQCRKIKAGIMSPEERVDALLKEGAVAACDDSVLDVDSLDILPDWYDEEKYKRGQKFFHDHIFVMMLSKLCGLITILAIPSILKLLVHTNMSGKALTAYKRYSATILHMCIWYDEDLKSNSKLWLSIADVRGRHFNASRKGCKAGLGKISQKDMALTQFGFMGYVLTNPKPLSLENVTKEELEGFIHVWRVVGHLMGIEDRFNICRESVEETREICHQIVEKSFKQALRSVDNECIRMWDVLLQGMTVFNPFLDFGAIMTFNYKLCGLSLKEISNNNDTTPIKITAHSRFVIWLMAFELWIYQFFLARWYLNLQQKIAVWLLEHFPFIAFYKFGYRNSHVVVIKNNNS